MTAKDHFKITQAGLTVIRKSHALVYNADLSSAKQKYRDICIKAKTKDRHDWFTLEKDFATLTARDKRVDELLRDKTIVEELQ